MEKLFVLSLDFEVYLLVNDVKEEKAYTFLNNSQNFCFTKHNLHAAIRLNSGDKVTLVRISGDLWVKDKFSASFCGWLIEEEMDKKSVSLPISTAQSTDPACQVKGLPTDCGDLRCRGHTLDGFFLVRSVSVGTRIDTVYCKFSKSSSTGSPISFWRYNSPCGRQLQNVC